MSGAGQGAPPPATLPSPRAIRLLPPRVADAIAAGEVVERPAAAVKELCENALDAGTRRVDVEIAGGGLVRIAVSDDGWGIPGDQLPLAVASHATSKVDSLDDLARVRSLGFRGEALASLAAVSDLLIVSRVRGADLAWRLRCRGGEILEHGVAARAPGTTAEVRDLFQNTPARLAFVRTETSEAAACLRAVADLALSRPEVGFTCRSGSRLALRTPGGSLRDAARAVYGRDAAEMLEVAAPGEVGVSGLISEPRAHRATRAGLVVVLNGRRIWNRALVTAVEEAYTGLLPPGRHPFGVVHLDLDPAGVDVNVHPAKREIRLRHEGQVFAALQRACWAALQGSHLRPAPARLLPAFSASVGAGGTLPTGLASLAPPSPQPARPDAELALGDGDAAGAAATRLPDLAPLRPLGQSADGWLVADSPRGLCLVDPHAAHEKVLYAELVAAAGAPGGRAASQPLLFEAVVTVDPATAERVVEGGQLLGALGVELELFGPGMVRCRAVPAGAAPRDPERLVREVLQSLGEGGDEGARRHRLAALTACHAAVRLGDRLGAPEQARLLERLTATPGGLTCPHGRPTVVVMDDASVRRAFGRPAL